SFARAHLSRPPLAALGKSILSGSVPHKPGLLRALGRRAVAAPDDAAVVLVGTRFTPVAEHPDDPPVLYVVVDTEADINWRQQPSTQTPVSVGVTSAPARAQTLFDSYGLRPIYVVDYPTAAQPERYESLRRILDSRRCAIGAHLHPRINPPLEEPLTERNSYAGNLTAGLEERKLRRLVQAVEHAFGVKPLFFKASRHGVGPNTYAILQQLGFAVDFSIPALADLRACGGPDFRLAQARPYRAGPTGPLALPVTRAEFGLLTPLPLGVRAALQSGIAEQLRLPAVCSRLGLVSTVTLAPDGVTARELVELLRRMARRGQRTFVLHLHRPSLVPGHTHRVRAETEGQLLKRLEQVCDFFFERLGGLPGNPADLLPSRARQQLWATEGARQVVESGGASAIAPPARMAV
ncbi:MAG: hypothetical protein M3Y41_14000, partial [Pseudomonadota bacterium]|nr:hypothetical protein [Pseudomonadota bacterium]